MSTYVITLNILDPTQSSPGFVVGLGRLGTPLEVKVYAVNAPSGGPLQLNITIDGVTLLAAPISIASGLNGPVTSTNFVGSPPPLNYNSLVLPVVVSGNGATLVTLELVVQTP